MRTVVVNVKLSQRNRRQIVVNLRFHLPAWTITLPSVTFPPSILHELICRMPCASFRLVKWFGLLVIQLYTNKN